MPGIIKPEQGSTVLKTKLEKIKPGQNWFKTCLFSIYKNILFCSLFIYRILGI